MLKKIILFQCFLAIMIPLYALMGEGFKNVKIVQNNGESYQLVAREDAILSVFSGADFFPVFFSGENALNFGKNGNTITLNSKKYVLIIKKSEELAQIDQDVKIIWLDSYEVFHEDFFKKLAPHVNGRILKVGESVGIVNYEFITLLKNLKYLDLSGSKVDNIDLELYISKLGDLEYLNLHSCENVSDEGIIKGVSKLARLVYLNLYECKGVTDNAIINGVSALKKLAYINLNGTSVTDEGVIKGIGLMKTLLGLNLGKTGVSDIGLIKGVSRLNQLTELNLYGCNNISDEGVIKSVANLKKMNRLILYNCPKVSDISLLQAINGLQNLVELDIGATAVSNQTAIESLSGLKNLSILALDRTGVSEEALSKLKASLPSCEIRR